MKQKHIRDIVAAIVSITFVACGFIGMHYDWTGFVMIIPFGWVIIGLLLDMAINGRGTNESIGNAACGVLLLLNMAFILVHRDTPFIVGRLLCCFGLVVAMIRATKNSEESTRKELNDTIVKMEKKCSVLNDQIDILIKAKNDKKVEHSSR